MTHAVTKNGHFRVAVERWGEKIVVSMQDFAGRRITAVFEDEALRSIASERDDEFFPLPTEIEEDER